ncbi:MULTISPECIES: hypothetical protein [unclassified Streptomyces]|uniref:hypothetical protein n=1 Tax=unclassified Streptomyces TaxID=2593676 RepID=UPI000DC2AB20|nr:MULTISPECIES: hypothetical protein [unclassified Streptomyces]MYT74982.1 hypothetical protein [Streptomyces sp. SID8367]RAJ71949.1 hypothetical protein K377_07532 [Streptomyces sp. PsTaAH-137]
MSTFKRRTFAGTGAAAALTAAMAFAATPASAVQYSVDSNASGKYSSPGQGSIHFQNDGDDFRVCDNWPDGAGVIGYWKVGSGGTVHSIYNGGGAQTCEERNENVSEPATVYLKVCLRDNGTVVTGTCSSWRGVSAG